VESEVVSGRRRRPPRESEKYGGCFLPEPPPFDTNGSWDGLTCAPTAYRHEVLTQEYTHTLTNTSPTG
jgi:hypothetical protein